MTGRELIVALLNLKNLDEPIFIFHGNDSYSECYALEIDEEVYAYNPETHEYETKPGWCLN